MARTSLAKIIESPVHFFELFDPAGGYGTLPQVLIYAFYQLFGAQSISLLTAICSLLIFLPFLIDCRLTRDNTLFLLFLLLAIITIRYRYLPRPELFGYIMFSWCSLTLRHYKRQPSLFPLAICLILLATWSVLHISWTIGALFLFLQFLLHPHIDILKTRLTIRGWKLVMAISLLAALPLVYKSGLFALHVLDEMGATGQLSGISEMRPIWEYPRLLFWYLLTAGIALKLTISIPPQRCLRLIAWGLAFTCGLIIERNVALATLGMLALAAGGGSPTWLRRWAPTGPVLASAVLFLILGTTVLEPRIGYGVRWMLFPKTAARFVKIHDLPTKVFNNLDCGGYLRWVWNGQPQHYLDGTLGTPYKMRVHDQLIEGRQATYLLKNEGFNTLLLQGTYFNSGRIYPIIPRLIYDPNWQLVSADDALVFTRPAPSLPRLPPQAAWRYLLRRLETIRKTGTEQDHYEFSKGICYTMLGETRLAKQAFTRGRNNHPELEAGYRYFERP
ncbi:hypothetical protein [Geothermobacter hydrogeniphilus]|nr:hypothetical protein [Geothermobacter hydrogeniphilus]